MRIQTCESMSNLLIDDDVAFDSAKTNMFVRFKLASFQVPLKKITMIFVDSYRFLVKSQNAHIRIRVFAQIFERSVMI